VVRGLENLAFGNFKEFMRDDKPRKIPAELVLLALRMPHKARRGTVEFTQGMGEGGFTAALARDGFELQIEAAHGWEAHGLAGWVRVAKHVL